MPPTFTRWEQAITLMKKEMAAAGLRAGTVEDYCTCLQTVRNAFVSGVLGPNDVPTDTWASMSKPDADGQGRHRAGKYRQAPRALDEMVHRPPGYVRGEPVGRG